MNVDTVTPARARFRYPGKCLLTLLLVTAVLAVSLTVNQARAETVEHDAEYWLSRLGPALNMTSYRGVFVYARGDQVSSMQIAHRYRNGVIEERLVPQDGASGEIVRKGTRVVCVLPDHGRIQLDQVIPSGPFAEAFSSQLMPVSRWYQPEMAGDDRIAGYEVVRLALRARDEVRYSHQLWLEKSTGLLVKSHVRSAEGKVLEHFQFTSLEITDALADSEFRIRTRGEEVARELAPRQTASSAPRMDGWTLTWQPEGFIPAAAPRSGKGQAVAFSDGLAAFSVFVEPARDMAMPTGASRIGATTVYMKQLDVDGADFTVTVVGEIPPTTARRVAEAVAVDDTLAFGIIGQ